MHWRCVVCIGLTAAARPAAPAAQSGGPASLVVILVVDQMRADYLTTFASRWQRGFRTLLERGTQFTNAEYPYWSTITCAGHTSIATGTLPRTHGMVLNRWWDRAERRVVDLQRRSGRAGRVLPAARGLQRQRDAHAGHDPRR